MPDTAQDIYDQIKAFNGGEVQNWNDVEDELFAACNQIFTNWLRNGRRGRGVVSLNRETVKKSVLQPKIVALEETLVDNHVETSFYDPKKTSGPGNDKTKKLGSDQLPDITPMYVISDVESFLGAIYHIGIESLAQTQPYVLHFPNGDGAGGAIEVFLSAKDHYAFPLEINGNQPDLTKYEHQYDKLLPPLANSFKKEQAENFFKQGAFPNTQLNTITALTANYFAESDRNQMQLFVTIIEHHLAGRTTPQSRSENKFTMLGGSWNSKWCWGAGENGNGKNNHSNGATLQTGRQQKRWGLSVIINDTVEGDVIAENKWIDFIKYLLSVPGGGAIGPKLSSVIPNEITVSIIKQLTSFAQ